MQSWNVHLNLQDNNIDRAIWRYLQWDAIVSCHKSGSKQIGYYTQSQKIPFRYSQTSVTQTILPTKGSPNWESVGEIFRLPFICQCTASVNESDCLKTTQISFTWSHDTWEEVYDRWSVMTWWPLHEYISIRNHQYQQHFLIHKACFTGHFMRMYWFPIRRKLYKLILISRDQTGKEMWSERTLKTASTFFTIHTLIIRDVVGTHFATPVPAHQYSASTRLPVYWV